MHLPTRLRHGKPLESESVIIDAHTHIHPEADAFGAGHDATLDNLLRNLDACEVERAVVLPIAADSPFVKRIENRFVHESCAKHPDRLIGFASVNPLETDDPAAVLEHEVRELNLKGLKLHPRLMGVSADDSRVVPLVQCAADLGIPVAIDCYLWKPTPLRMQLPMNVDVLCKRVPEAKVIMCHAGGFRFLDTLAVVKANDNVHVDTSLSLTYFAGTPFEDQFMFVLKQIGPRRIIYGSDHPQAPVAETLPRAREILGKHGFDKTDLSWILGRTFTSLFSESA